MLIAAMVGIGGIAAIYAFLATPTADDFCRASYSTAPGAWLTEVIETYYTWSGRWVAHTIYSILFPRLGITSYVYNVLVFLSPIMWFVTFYCFCHIVFRDALERGEKAFFAALLCCVYWAGMPSPSETWYWLTGSTEYQLPFLLMALSLVLLTDKWVTGPAAGPRIGAFVLGVLLAVLVAGLNELIALFLLGALGVAVALAALRGRPVLAALYAAAFVVTLAATVFNLAAPGAAVRAARDFPHRHDLKFAIGAALLDPEVAPWRWLADARLVSLTLLLLTSPWFARRAPGWLSWTLPGPKRATRWSVVVPATALAAVYLGTLAAAYAQGSWLPMRILDVLYAVFVVGWLAAVSTLAPLAHANATAPNAFTRGLQLVAAVALPVTLLAAPNTLNAVRGLPRTVLEWRPAINARDHAIRAAVKAGSADVTLDPIHAQPMMFFWRDQPQDRTHWRNTCMAAFYGARSIAVRSSAHGN
jgi:hypothetical protein